MFESIMWTYIKEEKELLSGLLKNKQVIEKIKTCKEIQSLYFVAHGSSYNAANAIAPFISKYSNIRTYVYTPSNFKNNALSIQYEDVNTTMVIGISQTGTSRGVLECIQGIKDKGYKVIGITNEKESPIDQLSDISFYLNCGIEDSNAKTKGYSSTLLLLMIFGIELGFEKGILNESKKNELYCELEKQINDLDITISNTIQWCQSHQYGKDMKNLYVVGNGMNFATAMEGQLKLMETQCIPTMFNDIVEFSHGMHRSLNKETNVLLMNSCIDCDLIEKTFTYLKEKNIPVCMIDAQGNTDPDIISVHKYEETCSILLITTVIQVISAFVPELNGMDPNREANNDYTECMETRV